MKPLFFFKFLLIFNFIYDSETVKFCPKRCTCLRNKVVCLSLGLVAVPDAPDDTYNFDVRFNKIHELQPGGFAHMLHLRSLLLNDNHLRSLHSGAFHGLQRLKYLYLYRNRINHISADVFKDLIHLEQLYLHVNEIHHLDANMFSNMPRLERLYLQNNRLKSVPYGSFSGMPRLRKLRLDSNALVCDCSMVWMVRMLAEHSGMDVAATCYEPASVTGTALASMSQLDFKCQLPTFETEPEDVVVNFGEDATFTCVATGDPAPEIVWLRDSAEIPREGTRYEILNNGTLMVHDADEVDIGVFECMAKNEAGQTLSKTAKMMVNKPDEYAPPIFTITPEMQTAKLGQRSVRFDCAANGKPKPHISWYFNGEKILLSDRMAIRHNGSIVIEYIQESDSGSYACQAANLHGKIIVDAELKIFDKPFFDTYPKSLTVPMGDNAEFFCSARGEPSPILTWYRDTLLLEQGENVEISNDHRKLTILEVSEEDDGIYHCRAVNSEGYIEKSALLKVIAAQVIPPRITLKPEDTEAFKETTVQMPCEVEAEPSAIIEWRRNGVRIIEADRFRVTVIGSLIINNVSVSDTGRYDCTIYNDYGRDTASAILTVKDRKLPGEAYVNIALIEARTDVDRAISNTIENLFNNQSAKINLTDLYRINSFPNEPAREVAKAAEIYERALDKVRDFTNAGLGVSSVDPFDYQHILSNKHLEVIAQLSGCVAHRETLDCSDMCFHSKYRSYDGTCNNFDRPTWGSSLSGFRRILFPVYENGFSHPVGWNKGRLYNGYPLPGSRLISNTLITTTDITEDVQISHMAMQWGQWLDHDLDHALPSVSSETWDGVDCKKTCEYAAPCFPMDVPENDTRVTNRRCIDFIRTSAVCGSGMTSVLFGALQPREQINQLTSFIDASQVYGFEKSVAEDLRDLTNENGLLRVGGAFPGRKPLLPTSGLNGMDCRRNLDESTRGCFIAGDIRANEQIGLTAFHTIWLREHNRVALKIKTVNPFWDGDRVYHEARKVVGALIQYITYTYWLPLILGPEGSQLLGEYQDYNTNINPSISNVFATAALRFGHSMINPILHRYDENFEPIPEGHLQLRDAFFTPWRLVDEGGVDPLIRGMFSTPAKLKTPTQNLNSELTEKLFHGAHAVALDLAAMNIQRSRDHGIPPYNKWRQFCNMSEVNSFDDLAGEISDISVREKLQQLYGSVDNIDVWVGGILEDQVQGGKVGPLFRCLLVEQFTRLRDGDRFWYENPSTFKREQLREIKKTSLARILCDNGDNIDTIGENVFLLPEVQGGMISCEDLPAIDFRYWAECENCEEDTVREKRRERRDLSHDELEQDGARLTTLENSQGDLTLTIQMLKKRIEFLEEHCKMETGETIEIQ